MLNRQDIQPECWAESQGESESMQWTIGSHRRIELIRIRPPVGLEEGASRKGPGDECPETTRLRGAWVILPAWSVGRWWWGPCAGSVRFGVECPCHQALRDRLASK